MKEVVAVLSGMVAVIVVLTLLGKGSFNLATGPKGPSASFGYRGY